MPISDKELDEVRVLGKEADASLACEGIFLTDEERAIFREMEDKRLTHAERRKFINDYLDRTIGNGIQPR